MIEKIIEWEEICQEYPKLKKLERKYKEPNRIRVYIELKTRPPLRYRTGYIGAIFEWSLYDEWQSEFSLEFQNINTVNVPKIGPVLVLGTLLFLKEYNKKEFDRKRKIYFRYVQPDGLKFWARFLGFGRSISDLIGYLEKEGEVVRSPSSNMDIYLSFEKFEKLVDKEWKCPG